MAAHSPAPVHTSETNSCAVVYPANDTRTTTMSGRVLSAPHPGARQTDHQPDGVRKTTCCWMCSSSPTFEARTWWNANLRMFHACDATKLTSMAIAEDKMDASRSCSVRISSPLEWFQQAPMYALLPDMSGKERRKPGANAGWGNEREVKRRESLAAYPSKTSPRVRSLNAQGPRLLHLYYNYDRSIGSVLSIALLQRHSCGH